MGVSEIKNIAFKVNGTDVSGECVMLVVTWENFNAASTFHLSVSSAEVPASMSLARFLRDRLHLTGTKISCGQGGCGACVVVAELKDADGTTDLVRSVNSVSDDN